jgi:hypothetical protein
MPNLPRPAEFCVYGLTPLFTGERWLAMWDVVDQSPGSPVWHVDLGHGSEDRVGPFAVVVTDGKITAAGFGPSGLEDVATRVILNLISVAYPSESGSTSEAALAEIAGVHDRRASRWAPRVIAVDDRPVEFMERRVGDVYAAVADLGPVAVGVCGRSVEAADFGLVSLSGAGIDAYRARHVGGDIG